MSNRQCYIDGIDPAFDKDHVDSRAEMKGGIVTAPQFHQCARPRHTHPQGAIPYMIFGID